MLPILQLGPFAVQFPGLIVLAGVWVGVELAEREAPRRGLSRDIISSLALTGLVAGLLGARIWYALRFVDVYLEDPLALIALNPSTLAPLEGAATGLIAAWIYGQRKRLPFWRTMDVLTIGMAAFMVFVALANFASGNAFGASTQVPWGIELWGMVRHPTQLYSFGLGLGVLAAIWRLKRVDAFAGFTWLAWLLLASASRLLVEGFRGDSIIVFGILRQAQLLSLLTMALSLAGLHLLAVRAQRQV